MSTQVLAPCCRVTRLSEMYSVTIPSSLLHLLSEFLVVLLLPVHSPHTGCLPLNSYRQRIAFDRTVTLCVSLCFSTGATSASEQL